MIKGNKPSAYGVTRDANGREILTEFRQCSHCQSTWQYIPGVSFGRRVGLCDYCMGLLCEVCIKRRWQMVNQKCVPFSEGVAENSNKYIYDDFRGIFLRK